MKLGIVGWYGTDTMGDRAILDGVLAIINKISNSNTVFLGSLFEFYSQRSLYEEKNVFKQTAPGTQIEIFDMRSKESSQKAIGQCDLLIVGGGPLMDIEELFLVEKCFRYAKKKGIPTAIVGCGVGPLSNANYRESVRRIFNLSDAIYLRDHLSVEVTKQLYGADVQAVCLGDPAIISIEEYEKKEKREKYIAINFRDYPKAAYSATSIVSDENFRDIIKYCSTNFEKVELVPMHTFYMGGDDRKYLTTLALSMNLSNVRVIHKPMNLHELYDMYANAWGCVGMRYHSIVMQTILNGNNIVLNYTDSKKGKISGFLDIVDSDAFYAQRKINLQDIHEWNCEDNLRVLKSGTAFEYEKSTMLDDYAKAFEKIMK